MDITLRIIHTVYGVSFWSAVIQNQSFSFKSQIFVCVDLKSQMYKSRHVLVIDKGGWWKYFCITGIPEYPEMDAGIFIRLSKAIRNQQRLT